VRRRHERATPTLSAGSGRSFSEPWQLCARPRPVFEAYQRWQRELERQPVAFLGRRWFELLPEVLCALASYVNAPAEDLVLIPNATFGVNAVARSLRLGTGDEVLTTTHEYGACDRIWRFFTRRSGATYVRQPIALPVDDPEAIVAQLWGRRHAPDAPHLLQPHYIADGAAHARRGNLRASARGRYSYAGGRRTRARADSRGSGGAGRRFLHGQLS
jgi:hypothetical protein